MMQQPGPHSITGPNASNTYFSSNEEMMAASFPSSMESRGKKSEICSRSKKQEIKQKETPQNLTNSGVSSGEEGDLEAYQNYVQGMMEAASEVRRDKNIEEFICLVCKKKFDYWAKLKRHLRIHAEFRPFKCELCNKAFYDFHKLKRHKQTHSGVKPYQCHICDQKVSRQEHLRRHLLTHVDEKPFKCNVCTFAARRVERVRSHQRKCHSDVSDLEVQSVDVQIPTQEGVVWGNGTDTSPTMVPTRVPAHGNIQASTSRDIDSTHSRDTTLAGNSYTSPPRECPDDGPVFPGQLSPTAKHVSKADIAASSPIKNAQSDNLKSAKAESSNIDAFKFSERFDSVGQMNNKFFPVKQEICIRENYGVYPKHTPTTVQSSKFIPIRRFESGHDAEVVGSHFVASPSTYKASYPMSTGNSTQAPSNFQGRNVQAVVPSTTRNS